MDKTTKKLFDVIFQEAHVIDVDFSRWDKEVSLVVVGGLVDANFDGAGPIHRVSFAAVEQFIWKSNHLEVTLDPDDGHCQWVIMDFEVRTDQASMEVLLKSVAPPTPDVLIKCQGVTISEVSASDIDLIHPGWNRPYAALARPGIETLARRVKQLS